MTLKEMSKEYRAAAEPLRQRLRELRQMLKATDDPDEIWHIKRRIADLTPMLTQLNEVAEVCDRYYEGSFYRSETITCNGLQRPKASTRCPKEEDDECNTERADTLAKGNRDLVLF